MLFTSWTITKFTDQKLKFVNFGHIALWDEVLNAFLSFLVFLSTIRILRVLNYSRSITHLAGVLSNARRNLLGCFFMFAVIFIAYAGFGYLLFGSDLETYKNMFVSITTIVNSLVGRNSLHGLIMAPCDSWILLLYICDVCHLDCDDNDVRYSEQKHSRNSKQNRKSRTDVRNRRPSAWSSEGFLAQNSFQTPVSLQGNAWITSHHNLSDVRRRQSDPTGVWGRFLQRGWTGTKHNKQLLKNEIFTASGLLLKTNSNTISLLVEKFLFLYNWWGYYCYSTCLVC